MTSGGWLAWTGADGHAWLAVGALAIATVLCRACFLLPVREPRMPSWLRRGLRHAPLAALMAIVAPAVMQPGAMDGSPSARWWALAACAAWFFGLERNVTLSMLAGAAVYLGLRWLG